MKTIQLPYGRTTLQTDINDELLQGIWHAPLPEAAIDAAAEVERALDFPIDSPPLEELARGRKNAVIIASDHTRPVPSRILIPAMLKRLRKFSPEIHITILVATGCHRATTQEELLNKFGSEIFEHENIIVHDCDDTGNLCDAGTLPSGGKLILNKLIMETELLVSEGFIEPHFFAGFSGGRKSVLPGVAGRATVLANHCSEFIRHPAARTGILENNPIHEDMLFAARRAKLAFILNVVLNSRKELVRAFAGGGERLAAADATLQIVEMEHSRVQRLRFGLL